MLREAPTVAELRAACQPAAMMARRSGEHWAGLLYMRRLSPYATCAFVRLRAAPNQLTGLMIVCGVAGGIVVGLGGLAAAVGGALLIQAYLLLDCSDGELARWTGRTSVTGVYLDRVGHYVTEAALLIGLGVRAQAGGLTGGWVVIGLAAAVGAILIKAETDLVDVARVRSGKPAATEAAASPRNRGLGLARRAAGALRFHRIIQAIELSLLVLAAAIYDTVTGGLLATRVLAAACAVVAAIQLVLHLVSVLASRRLDANGAGSARERGE
ncbi:MAG: CDP-alcohol phosphatidyltransferase family protein [Streptosporangiaceae bacterium]